MPRANPQAQSTAKYRHPNSFVEVFDAAWVVVGRRAYALRPDEETQLRLDLAICIGRLFNQGVTDPRELVRRSIMRFVN
jgi:hypothetical protein